LLERRSLSFLVVRPLGRESASGSWRTRWRAQARLRVRTGLHPRRFGRSTPRRAGASRELREVMIRAYPHVVEPAT